MKKSYWILVLAIIIFIVVFLLVECQPEPTKPTPTNTKVIITSTATYTPTKTEQIFIPTETQEPTSTPTLTPTATKEPTKTPKPTEFILYVHTGYENGLLHFRPGPSKRFIPEWFTGIGAFSENTALNFVDCPVVENPWVHVIYQKYSGYVYGEYLNINPCPK